MGKLVPLATLVSEEFASSPSEMFMLALDLGLPVGIDGRGRVGVDASAVDKMRQQRREREAAEAAEAERQRIAAQDAAVGELVRAAEQEETRARIRRIEAKVGPVWAIAAEMTKLERLQPGYRSLDEEAASSQRVPTLDEIEAYARAEYSLDLSA